MPSRIGVHAGASKEYGSAGSSVTTAAVTTQATGSLIVCGSGIFSLATEGGAPTDSKSNTYSQIGTTIEYDGMQGSGTKLWAKVNATGGSSHTFTKGCDANGEAVIAVLEIPGATALTGVTGEALGEQGINGSYQSQTITVDGPAVLFCFLFGGLYFEADPSAQGWQLVEEFPANAISIQCSLFTRFVDQAGQYSCLANTTGPSQVANMYIGAAYTQNEICVRQYFSSSTQAEQLATIAATLPEDVKAGSQVLVHAEYYSTPLTSTTAADNINPGNYVNVGTVTDTSVNYSRTTLMLQNTAAGELTVTVTFPTAVIYRAIQVIEIDHANSVNPFDGYLGNFQATPGTGTDACTSGTLTVTNGTHLVVGVNGNATSNTAAAVGTGFVILGGTWNASGENNVTETKVNYSSTTSVATFTAPDNDPRMTSETSWLQADSGVTCAGTSVAGGPSSAAAVTVGTAVTCAGTSVAGGPSSAAAVTVGTAITCAGTSVAGGPSSAAAVTVGSAVTCAGTSVAGGPSSAAAVTVGSAVTCAGTSVAGGPSSAASVFVEVPISVVGASVAGGPSSAAAVTVGSAVTCAGTSVAGGPSSAASVWIGVSQSSSGVQRIPGAARTLQVSAGQLVSLPQWVRLVDVLAPCSVLFVDSLGVALSAPFAGQQSRPAAFAGILVLADGCVVLQY